MGYADLVGSVDECKRKDLFVYFICIQAFLVVFVMFFVCYYNVVVLILPLLELLVLFLL